MPSPAPTPDTHLLSSTCCCRSRSSCSSSRRGLLSCCCCTASASCWRSCACQPEPLLAAWRAGLQAQHLRHVAQQCHRKPWFGYRSPLGQDRRVFLRRLAPRCMLCLKVQLSDVKLSVGSISSGFPYSTMPEAMPTATTCSPEQHLLDLRVGSEATCSTRSRQARLSLLNAHCSDAHHAPSVAVARCHAPACCTCCSAHLSCCCRVTLCSCSRCFCTRVASAAICGTAPPLQLLQLLLHLLLVTAPLLLGICQLLLQ